MRGIWRNFWLRTCVTVFLAAVAIILFDGLPLVHLAWGGGVMAPWGVLDFAGGSVVHVNPWLLILLSWIAAEIKAFRTGTPLLLGSYLLFALTVPCAYTLLTPVVIFVASNVFNYVGYVNLIVTALLAFAVGLIPASIYAAWKKPVTKTPDVF